MHAHPLFGLRGLSLSASLGVACLGCSDEASTAPPSEPGPVVVTFNTGTSEGLGHDAPPDDGYGEEQALISDMYYGDGLAWLDVVEDTTAFLAEVQPDVIAFQEIFYSGDCDMVPAEGKPGFVCETYQPGDPTVAQVILGAGYQVACHLGKNDKCAAVKRSFGRFAGCDQDFCLEGLAGAQVMDCGSGSRVGRAVVELSEGGTFTLVSVHGSSGLTQEDQDCRREQFIQVFEDMGAGDGPAANGERNLVMGDFNTDPGLNADFDESAAKVLDHVGDGQPFHFISDDGPDAPKSYANFVNIDHVISDAFDGSCWVAGLTDGHPAVSDVLYFDHKPIVCQLDEPL
jgi:endonuclease/exonuclease/phosphatase family metal-dependent hydrolase